LCEAVDAFSSIDGLDRDQDSDLWRDLNQAPGSHSTRLRPARSGAVEPFHSMRMRPRGPSTSMMHSHGFAADDAHLGSRPVFFLRRRCRLRQAIRPRPPRFFAALPRFRFWKSYRMKAYIEESANGAGHASMAQRLAGFPPYLVAFVKADLDAARLRDVPVKLTRKLAGRPSLLRP
jgi:hypothetical protein